MVTRILDHLKLPSTAPMIAESRLHVMEEPYCDVPSYNEIDAEWGEVEPLDTGPPDARDPP